MERRSKFFRLQIGTKIDAVSLDRLKPVISDCPVVPAATPPWGRPPLRPSKHPPDPSSTTESSDFKKKSVVFLTNPEIIPRRNPHRHARIRSSCSALTQRFLLWGSTVAEDEVIWRVWSRISRRHKRSVFPATSSIYIRFSMFCFRISYLFSNKVIIYRCEFIWAYPKYIDISATSSSTSSPLNNKHWYFSNLKFNLLPLK